MKRHVIAGRGGAMGKFSGPDFIPAHHRGFLEAEQHGEASTMIVCSPELVQSSCWVVTQGG